MLLFLGNRLKEIVDSNQQFSFQWFPHDFINCVVDLFHASQMQGWRWSCGHVFMVKSKARLLVKIDQKRLFADVRPFC